MVFQALTAKDAIARKKAAMPPEIAKAVGRLASGLYIVTAAQNNARSAMVASWVSQVRVCVILCVEVCVCVKCVLRRG